MLCGDPKNSKNLNFLTRACVGTCMQDFFRKGDHWKYYGKITRCHDIPCSKNNMCLSEFNTVYRGEKFNAQQYLKWGATAQMEKWARKVKYLTRNARTTAILFNSIYNNACVQQIFSMVFHVCNSTSNSTDIPQNVESIWRSI